MMPFEDIQIQLVDLPPVGNESTDGWVSGILRYSDALLIVIDLTDAPDIQAELLIDQVKQWNIRVIAALETAPLNSEPNTGVVKKAVIIGNKADLPGADEGFYELNARYGRAFRCISVSARKKENLEELKRALFELSGIIRVYSKPPGKEPDFSAPFTVPSGSRVFDLAKFIHKDFASDLKFARIWGSSKFDGQRVEKHHILKDRDIVEINI